MKRFIIEDHGEMDSINIANVLMLLAAGSNNSDNSIRPSPPRVFECKTCNRQFPSFQALGGHRASHKKPRTDGDLGQLVLVKTKVHECSVCGLEFAVGQALGGHMRRHRAKPEEFSRQAVVEKKSAGGKSIHWLDLNFPPSDEDEEMLKMGLGLGKEMVGYSY